MRLQKRRRNPRATAGKEWQIICFVEPFLLVKVSSFYYV
jgi:hypothetical protein